MVPGIDKFVAELVKEMFGSMNEKGPWINLSDGGHIENLGVYELLRRRCKYIFHLLDLDRGDRPHSCNAVALRHRTAR